MIVHGGRPSLHEQMDASMALPAAI